MKHPFNPQFFQMLGVLHAMTARFALIKFGGGIVKMSGSIAGNTFARNRFGDYARSWKKPVNPRSLRQERIKSIVSYLAEYWHGTMLAPARALWGEYAAAVTMKNKLGDDITLTGFNHFIRSNSSYLMAGGAVLAAAPTIKSLPTKDNVLQCEEESIADQTFTFVCSPLGWGANGDPKGYISLHQGRAQLGSRNFFHGPWRLMGRINNEEGLTEHVTEPAAFPFALGQKVWFQARVMTESGRLSELWDLAPRDIEKDPDA